MYRRRKGRPDLKYRVVKSRGKRYLQIVRYRWDPVERRGVTEFVRHVGPLSKHRSATPRHMGRAPVPVETVAQFLQRQRLAEKRPIQKKRLSQLKSAMDAVTRDGGRTSDEELFLQRIVVLVRQLTGPVYRGRITRTVRALGLAPPSSRFLLQDQVGVALTRLVREGRLVRRGRGGPSDPFLYSCPRSA